MPDSYVMSIELTESVLSDKFKDKFESYLPHVKDHVSQLFTKEDIQKAKDMVWSNIDPVSKVMFINDVKSGFYKHYSLFEICLNIYPAKPDQKVHKFL